MNDFTDPTISWKAKINWVNNDFPIIEALFNDLFDYWRENDQFFQKLI